MHGFERNPITFQGKSPIVIKPIRGSPYLIGSVRIGRL
jgi:hypothetical protein